MSELQEAVQAIKAGDKSTGQRLLTQLIQTNPDNERAWLWLAVVVENPSQKKQCLQRVLAINPNNTTAQQGLVQLETNIGMVSEPTVEEIVAPKTAFQSPSRRVGFNIK